MSLPRHLELDVRDLLGGLLVPEPQTCVLAAPGRAAPRRYLQTFPWNDFERRIRDSLAEPEAWVARRHAP